MHSFKTLLSAAAVALLTLPALAQTTAPAAAPPAPADAATAQPAAPVMPAVGTTKPIPAAEHFEGGQVAMYEFIQKNLQYPPQARRNRIQGQCIIGFTLNDDGKLSDVTVLKNIGGGCGEEALRVVRLLKFKGPGYAIKTSLPIMFKL